MIGLVVFQNLLKYHFNIVIMRTWLLFNNSELCSLSQPNLELFASFLIFRKRLNNEPLFFHAYTSLINRVHAWKNDGPLFKSDQMSLVHSHLVNGDPVRTIVIGDRNWFHQRSRTGSWKGKLKQPNPWQCWLWMHFPCAKA